MIGDRSYDVPPIPAASNDGWYFYGKFNRITSLQMYWNTGKKCGEDYVITAITIEYDNGGTKKSYGNHGWCQSPETLTSKTIKLGLTEYIYKVYVYHYKYVSGIKVVTNFDRDWSCCCTLSIFRYMY